MRISLSTSAARHIAEVLGSRPDALGLRLGLKASGCSGFRYEFEPAEAVEEDDEVLVTQGVTLIVSRQCRPFLEGMHLDYIREGLNQRLAVTNPNVTAECGCGESFAVS